jgi:DNA-binding response OmpR family regulator
MNLKNTTVLEIDLLQSPALTLQAPHSVQPQFSSGNFGNRLKRNRVGVFAVSQNENELRVLRDIFSRSNWELQAAGSLQEALGIIERDETPVVLYDRGFGDDGWREMLQGVDGWERPPHVIVASDSSETALWAEVINLGGFDLLVKPFTPKELFWVISLAWRQWHVQPRGGNRVWAMAGALGCAT